jgi:hypothetical protein
MAPKHAQRRAPDIDLALLAAAQAAELRWIWEERRGAPPAAHTLGTAHAARPRMGHPGW